MVSAFLQYSNNSLVFSVELNGHFSVLVCITSKMNITTMLFNGKLDSVSKHISERNVYPSLVLLSISFAQDLKTAFTKNSECYRLLAIS